MSAEQKALIARCRAAHEQAQRQRDEAQATAKAQGWHPGTEPPDYVVEARQAAGAAYCALDDALIGRTLPKPGIGSTTPGTIEEFREDADRIAGMLGKPLAAAVNAPRPAKPHDPWSHAIARHTAAFMANQTDAQQKPGNPVASPKSRTRSTLRGSAWDYAIARHTARGG